ncbi:MAG: hypothetical protein E5V85_23600, partial [Mesorhizobium sp.]
CISRGFCALFLELPLYLPQFRTENRCALFLELPEKPATSQEMAGLRGQPPMKGLCSTACEAMNCRRTCFRKSACSGLCVAR